LELLVASTIVTAVLFCAYDLYIEGRDAAERTIRSAADRSAAKAVVEHFAKAFEEMIVLPHRPAIDSRNDGESCVLMLAVSRAWDRTREPAPSIELRRYTWGFDGDRRGTVHLQQRPYSGSADVGIRPAKTYDAGDPWRNVPRVVIARDVKRLVVQFRSLGDRHMNWKRDWDDEGMEVAVRIRARVGEGTVERIAAPHADIEAFGEGL
jgi:hypothetical protein